MRKLAYYLATVLAMVVITQSTAFSVYDAPHNEANNIFCGDCHGKALDIRDSEDNPIVSPFWDGTSSADEVYNALCLRCHNGSDAPLANSHVPGTTLIKCTICHHNHNQDQVYPGKYNKNNFFIARGTALSAVESGGLTTISYTVPTGFWATNPGSDWAADLAKLADKTEAGRGAMLVPTVAWSQSRWPVFEIESINTTTGEIVVKGDASTTAAELKARAADFGIFYGQQIRSIITYEGNVDYVQFFDNKGNYSFVNQTAATGLCQICHSDTNHFQSTLGAAPGGDNHNQDTDCAVCHMHNNLAGAFDPSIDHDGPDPDLVDGPVDYPLVADADDCDLCHTGGTISGSNIHDSQCSLCHLGATYDVIKTVAQTGGRVTSMPVFGDSSNNSCGDCHGDHRASWYNHEVNHTGDYANDGMGWVGPNSASTSNTVNCTGCHTYNYTADTNEEEILLVVHDLVTASGVRQTVCNQCHDNLSVIYAIKDSAAGNGGAPHGAAVSPASNECITCHDGHFEDHTHVHDVSYNAAVDRSQNNNIPANACAVCHNDSGNSFAAFTDIEYEHDVTDGTQDGTGSCVTCHDYDTIGNQTGDADTPLSATVTSLIDNNTTSTCVTCHDPKNWVNGVSSEHGGHENNHFAWDSNCIDCHSTANDYIVQEVHGNTCLMCHTTAAGGTGTAKIGAAANGVDADASLGASAAPHAGVACTTCHALADADVNAVSIGGIHHDNKTDGVVVEADCAGCHTVSGHEGNHTALIDDSTTYCVACHTGIEGGGAGTGAPIAPADPEVHDGCTTCHAITAIPAADGYLLNFATADTRDPDVIDAMPNGGAGTNNGGGQCTACHVAWDAMHSHAITDFNSDLANCNSACHIKLPAEGVVQDTHSNDCSFCHNTTTYQVKLGDSFLALDGPKGDATKAIGNMAANCIVCHDVVAPVQFDFSTIHHETTNGYADAGNCVTCHVQFTSLGGDHTALVDEGATGCDSCHDAIVGTATGIPVAPANDEVHDACITCHNTDFDATLKTLVQADAHNPDWITAMPNGGAGSDNGGGVCSACHGAYFINHDHGLETPSYAPAHDVSYDALTDLSQVSMAGDNPCADCHDDTSGALASWTDIAAEHDTNGTTRTDSCATCHSYTSGTTPPFATVVSVISNNTTSICTTCHTPKLDPAASSDHGGHDDTHFAWTASCGTAACHNQAGNPGVANDIHGNGTQATCTLCHSTPGGGTGTAKIGAAANGVDADATLGNSAAPHAAVQCTTCHDIADADVNAATLGGMHHDNKTDGVVVEADCTTKCHNVSGQEGDHTALIDDAPNNCNSCHTGTEGGGAGTGAPIASGDDKIHDMCTTCHAIAATPGADGYLLDFATADATDPDRITAMPNGGAGTNNGGGDCNDCHGAYFDSHIHGVDGGYVDHVVSYNAATDLAQAAPGTPCAPCHTNNDDATGTALDSWTDIIGEHTGSCAICHSYTAGTTPPFATVVSAISAGAAVTCVDCHTPKIQPLTHQLHDATHFAWTASCGSAVGCHNEAGNPDVANDIHGNGTTATCTLCHSTTYGGTGTAKVGAAANGVDGDATLGIGAAPHAAIQCTTCHDLADADVNAATLGGIHHDNKTDGVVDNADCTTKCHTVNGQEGDHTARIDDSTTYCVACHTNVEGGGAGTGAPVDSGDAEAHDGCTTCHGINGAPARDSYLLAVGVADTRNPDVIDAMPNGGAGTNNGGGQCTACHVAWDAMHSHAITDFNSDLANCNSACHIKLPAEGVVQDTHSNDCSFCHNTTTYQVKLGDSFLALDGPKGDATKAIGNMAANCIVCHDVVAPVQFDFSTIHHETTNNIADLGNCVTCHVQFTSLGGDHTALVDEGATGCDSCHDAIIGTATGVPVAPANDEVHDACITCHNTDFDATLKTLVQADAHNPDWITAMPNGGAGSNNGGGVCSACHGAYFINHDHGLETPSYAPAHDTSYSALVDLSQVSMAGDNPCADCHDDTSGALASWTDIAAEHDTSGTSRTDSCATCHSYTSGTTPPFATVQSVISNNTTTTCVICHTPKLDPDPLSDHGGHDDTHFAWAGGCENCHGAGAAAEAVVRQIHSNNCALCHTNPTGTNNAGTEGIGPNGDGNAFLANGDAGTWTSTCVTCHNQTQVAGFHGITIAEATSSHQLSSDSSGGYDCEACHTTNVANEQLVEHMDGTDTPAQCAAMCHANTTPSNTSGIVAKTVIDTAVAASAAANCEECHAAKDDFDLHGLSDDNGPDTINTVASGGTKYHDQLGNSTGIAPTFTGKLAPGSYGGLLATEYNCGQCHSPNPDSLDGSNNPNINDLQAMQLHTLLGGGSGDCLTCHTFGAVADEIATGQGGTTVTCENCHASANGNGPSGEAMYQYDGARHHKTPHAQAGDCTYCHADPRPTNIATTGSGFAHNADEETSDAAANLGTYTSGWVTDYSVSYPVDTTGQPNLANDAGIKKQVACRLCHTNYGTNGTGNAYSVNNFGGNGNQGYNIAGYSGTATERTSGLTVYRNDFNAGPSGAPADGLGDTVSATRITQTVMSSHRIAATGGGMINVYDYGACLGCHSVQIMHAAPIPGADYPAVINDIEYFPFDTLRYAPGRSVFNLLRGVNPDNTNDGDVSGWNQHRLMESNGMQDLFAQTPAADPRGKDYLKGMSDSGQNVTTAADWNFNFLLAHNTQDAPLGTYSHHENLAPNPSGQAPAANHEPFIVYFADIAAPAIPDGVNFISAVWDGATVTVQAINDDGCAALSARTQPDGVQRIAPGGFSGVPCSGTFALGSITGVTLDIETTNAAGTDDTGNSITDDSAQPGEFTFTSATYAVAEDGGTVTIFVNRTGGDGAVTVDYDTADGTAFQPGDYTAASGTLSWVDTETGNKSFTVTVIDDAVNDGDQTFTIGLNTPTGGAAVGTPGNTTVTIQEDDQPGSFRFSSSTYTVAEDGTTATIAVQRYSGNNGAASVRCDTSNGTAVAGTDYTATTDTLNWADQDSADKNCTVPITDDAIYEGDLTVNLALTNKSAGTLYGTPNTAVLTIQEDEVPPDAVVSGQANWTPGAAGGAFDNTQDFAGMANIPQGSFGSGTGTGPADSVTWTPDYTGAAANAWATGVDTPSGTAGPDGGGTGGAADPMLYSEASGTAFGTPAEDGTITSSNLDASDKTFTLSFAYNANNVIAGHGLYVEVDDGGGFVLDTTVIDSGTSTRGTQNGTWINSGDIVLSGYSSATMQVRIRFDPADNNFSNDMGIDDIRIRTPGYSSSATLDVLAANTNGTASGNQMWATYNGNDYAMSNISGNQWQLVAETDLTDTYVNAMNIWTTQDATGINIGVTNDAGAPAWPTIAVTFAEWDGTDAVIYATTSWNAQDLLYANYNGSGATPMTWNGAQSRWEITFSSVAYAANVTVTSEAASNSPQVQAVTDLTAGDALSAVSATWGLAGDGMTLVITGTSSEGNVGNTWTVFYYDNSDRAGTETQFDQTTHFAYPSWSGNDFTITIGTQGTPLNPVTWFRDRVQVTNDNGGDTTPTLAHNCTMDPIGTYIEFENYDNFVERDPLNLSFSAGADVNASNGAYGTNAGAGDTLAPGYPVGDFMDRDRADFGATGAGLNFGAAPANWYWQYRHYDTGGGDSVFWGVDSIPRGAQTYATALQWRWAATNQNGANFFNMSGNHYISMWPREGTGVRYDGFLMATGAWAEANGSVLDPETAAFTYKVIQPNRCP